MSSVTLSVTLKTPTRYVRTVQVGRGQNHIIETANGWIAVDDTDGVVGHGEKSNDARLCALRQYVNLIKELRRSVRRDGHRPCDSGTIQLLIRTARRWQ